MKIGYGNYCYDNNTWKHNKSKVIMIKHSANPKSSRGVVYAGNIFFPTHLIGKKVRIKIEFLEDEKNE